MASEPKRPSVIDPAETNGTIGSGVLAGEAAVVARAGSLIEIAHDHARQRGERLAFTFVNGIGEESESLSFRGLDGRARAVAARLRERYDPGDRALLLFHPGLDFVIAFLGCLYSGVLAVPAHPPRRGRDQPRLRSLVADCRPRVVLTTAELAQRSGRLQESVRELRGAGWLPLDALAQEEGDDWEVRPFAPDAPAFLQYTSGSTGRPRGVVVTHGGLLHNEELIRRAFEQSESSVVVGWLPLFHDMGLIGTVLQPLYVGARAVLMSPVSFLQRPRRWLEAIDRYRATTSGGPDFAYDLCVRRIAEDDRQGLDLSSWRVAFNGAEPVRARTLDRFARAFAPCGFRREAFLPCYGLAEATLFVSGGAPGEAPMVQEFDKEELLADRGVPAVPAGDGTDGATRLVASGERGRGQRVEVVDPGTRQVLPPGRVGEIWVAGPSLGSGYWGSEQESSEVFEARTAGGDGPFLRTGDLGFVHGGHLFVTGRRKDLIIVRGRNHYPQDLEETASRAHPTLRPGGGAAFSIDRDGAERVVVVHEVDRGADRTALPAAVEAVRRAIVDEHEVAVDEVVLVRRGQVPRTSSGKVRRAACRDALEAGELAVLARSSLARERAVVGPTHAPPEDLDRLAPEARREAVASHVAAVLRDVAAPEGLDPLADPERPLSVLGVDSLAAAQIRNAVESGLGVELSFGELLADATVGELIDRIDRAVAAGCQAVGGWEREAKPDGGSGVVTDARRALWLAERLSPGRGVYHLAGAAWTGDPLSVTALSRCLGTLARRHVALRTSFPVVDGEPVAQLHDRLEPEVAVAEARAPEEARRWIEGEARRPFDLERGPLIRLAVQPLAAGGTLLALVVHHLVSDFRSLEVLLAELELLYLEETVGRPARLPPVAANYADFLARRRLEGVMEDEPGEPRRLGDGEPPVELPTDRPRSGARVYTTGRSTRRVGSRSRDRLTELARDTGATPFSLVLSAFQVLQARYTGAAGVTVLCPVSRRDASALERLVGYCTEPLPIRGRVEPGRGFRDFAAAVAAEVRATLDRPVPVALPADARGGPPARTLCVLHRTRRAGGSSLAAFALGTPGVRMTLGDLALESIALPPAPSELELSLAAGEIGDALVLCLDHARELFDDTTGRRLLDHLGNLLAAAVERPDLPFERLPLLSPAERLQALWEWQGLPLDGAAAPAIHERFAERARRHPDAIAVVDGHRRTSYGELLRRVRRLAARLRTTGVGPEVRVAVVLDRGTELVTALLAVLEAGGAYVPIDPSYPEDRRLRMLQDSGAALGIAGEDGRDWLADLGVASVSPGAAVGPAPSPDAPAARPSPENLAYVIYTSGSTGRPKGVAIRHRNAAALVAWALARFEPRAFDGMLASTSVCFDLSVFELFATLAAGGKLVLSADALELPRTPAGHEVRTVNTVPSAAAELVRLDGLPLSVERVLLAGEPLRRSVVDALYARPGITAVENLYGPSEDTTYSTRARVRWGQRGAPTIGTPVDGSTAYVVSAAGEPVPVGVAGELLLGGEGVTRGYLGRPAATSERFVPDPFGAVPGGRLYRTGDRVRRLADGEVEFLGRLDHQIKVRGFRVEPGEVETALTAHPSVGEAVVVAVGGDADPEGEAAGERHLAAYVVPADGGKVDVEVLRAHLSWLLPRALLPSPFVVLGELPRHPNGKIDRSRLPAPERRAALARTVPRTYLEERLASIWGEVVGGGEPGVHDDFFNHGGHSLLGSRILARVRERLGADLPLAALYEAPTVAGLASRVEEALAADGVAPTGAGTRQLHDPESGPAPLSYAQERLWLLDRLEPGSPAYHMAGAVDLDGPLDPPALARILAEIARRHEILRTSYPEVDGRAVQVVEEPGPVALPSVALDGLSGPEARREAARIETDAARRTFDLAAGPVWRALLLRLGPEEHRLAITLHHIAGDEASLDILTDELTTLLSGRGFDLPSPSPLRYADHALGQRQRAGDPEVEANLEWWCERLAGLRPLEMPTDRSRPAARSSRGATVERRLDPALAGRVRRFARESSNTLYVTLLAGFAAVLSRLGATDDLPVGTPVSGRDQSAFERVLGFFVDTVVLRVDASGRPGFRELVDRLGAELLEAREHRRAPFELLVERLQPARALDRNPLFDVLFALQRPPGASTAGALRLAPRAVDTRASKFDLSLFAADAPAGDLRLALEHSVELFDPTTARRMLRHFETLLAAAVARPDTPITELPMLSPAERQAVVREWQGEPLAVGEPVPGRIAARAAWYPDAVALVHGNDHLSRGELARRVAVRAGRLRSLGVGPETLVAVIASRTPALVEALLAIQAVGAAYVPIDPAYPAPRVAFLLRDSGASLLWSGVEAAAVPPAFGGRVLALDEDAPEVEASGAALDDLLVVPHPEQLAYVIYTSGSTGTPKGVGIRHDGLAALVDWAGRRYGGAERRGVLASTSVCFDLSAFELFTPLALGGTVILVDDALALAEAPDAHRVTLVNSVPSALSALLEARGLPSSIRTVNLAGEVLDRRLADAVLARPGVEALYNLYGPSEETTYSTEERVPAGTPAAPTIGLPLAGGAVHLLDGEGRPVPIGVKGDLWLRGPGLARGYAGRPGPTADRFRPDPFGAAPGGRIYRTGDLALRRPDGRLRFLGREDRQVKIRGHRIELGEVESTLGRHPAVTEATVDTFLDARDELGLVAYVVARGADEDDLRHYLARRLPAHLVPDLWIALPSLPRTPNGKLDRGALPDPSARPSDGVRTGSRTPVEGVLLQLCRELLPRDACGLDDDFFQMGGHSLLAARLVSRIREVLGVDLGVRAVFEDRTVARLARRVERARREAPPRVVRPIEPSGDDGPAPLSFSQERLWFLDRLDGGSPVYNLPLALRIRGPLRLGALRRALERVVERQEALRTVFQVRDGRPMQVVRSPASLVLPVIDLSLLAPAARSARIAEEARAEALRSFDLAADSLLRVRLLRLGAQEHHLLLTLHHIVADGWSLGVLMEELEAGYGAEIQGVEPRLPELPIQYRDYARWRRAELAEADLEPMLRFWRRMLDGAPAILELPTDRPRPPIQSHRGGSWRVELPERVTDGLIELSRRHRVTLFMTLVAVFSILLSRLTGRSDLVLGTPTSGRPRSETEPLIGLFAESLVLRVDLTGDPAFGELLKRTRSALVEAYAHQDLPFEKLVEELHPRRDLSHNPIYQVVIALEENLRPDPALSGLEVAAIAAESWTAKFDLALYLENGPRGLAGLLEYGRDLFDPTTAARMLHQFGSLAAEVVEHPERPISSLDALPAAERQMLLVEANDTRRAPPTELFVDRDFESRAAAAPDAPAVRGADCLLTYGELDRRANGLAHRLRALGVGPDVPVGVSVGRRPELVVALLGILKAGGAYLPLDPDYPPERRIFMLEDSGSPVLITDGEGSDGPRPAAVAVVDSGELRSLAARRPPALERHPDHLSYVIYTSGSTGRPKGVMITHRSLASYTRTAVDAYGVGPGDRVLQFCSISFDISLEEIVPCLARGGELVLRDDATVASIPAFVGACLDHRLTVLSLPTAFWHELGARLDVEGGELPPALRLVIIAGERALPERLETWLRHAPERPRLVNTYGLTESTIISTLGDLTARGAPAPGREVPIGRTVPDSELFVLDGALAPTPLGVPGEIYIGGGLLARGYLNRVRITAERFVPHPFADAAGARAYRTGDVARPLPDGELEFMGRTDHQVKVRGYRVELGEIEAALAEHPAIDAAVVAALEQRPGDKRLVAYLVLDEAEPPSSSEIRTFLGDRLPEYMVPSRYVLLATLPLTPNGKVDRAALPAPDGERPELSAEYVAPRDDRERELAALWAEVLGVERVGVDDNFFDLGGHSLLLVRLHERLRERFGHDLPIVELFAHPTVGALARRLSRDAPADESLDAVRQRAAGRRAAIARERYREARGRSRG